MTCFSPRYPLSARTLPLAADRATLQCELSVPVKAYLAVCLREGDGGCELCAAADEIAVLSTSALGASLAAEKTAPRANVPVRVYLPRAAVEGSAAESLPIIIFCAPQTHVLAACHYSQLTRISFEHRAVHGGGWVIGSPASHDGLCSALSARTHACVVSVDYALAPEHRFPAANDDCLAALEYCHAHADELCARAMRALVVAAPHVSLIGDKIVLSGDSAGGQLTLATLLYARDHELPAYRAIRATVPIYPSTDLLTCTPSLRLFGATGAILRQVPLAMNVIFRVSCID